MPPSPPESESEEADTSELGTHLPRQYASGRAQSSDIESRPAVLRDPMEISDEEMETGDDHLVYFSNRDAWGIGRICPTSTLLGQGIITCPWHHGSNLPNATPQFLPADAFHGRRKPESHLLFTAISTIRGFLRVLLSMYPRNDWIPQKKSPIF